MTRSRWPLYSVLTVGIIVLTGVAVWWAVLPHQLRNPKPFDVRSLGLGSKATLVATMSTDCESCVASIDFYKQLMAMSEMDGVERRLVVVSMNGVVPFADAIEPRGFKPHALTSGPGMRQSLPGARWPGVLLLLDAGGAL
jgi:hypothetical protein